MLRRFWVLGAAAAALSAAVSSPPVAVSLQTNFVGSLKTRPKPQSTLNKQNPNLRSFSTKARSTWRYVSSEPRFPPPAGRLNFRRSDQTKQRRALQTLPPSGNRLPTARSIPSKSRSAISLTHRAKSGPPKLVPKLRSHTQNEDRKKKSISPTAPTRLVPPPLPPDETLHIGRRKADATNLGLMSNMAAYFESKIASSKSIPNLQSLDAISLADLPMYFRAPTQDAVPAPDLQSKSQVHPTTLSLIEELKLHVPPIEEYYNASLGDRMASAVGAELRRFAVARRRLPPPPPGLPHPLPQLEDLHIHRRADDIKKHIEAEDESLSVVHDIIRQAIYQAQERVKLLQKVIDRYKPSLFFRMAFVFRKLEEEEKDLYTLFTSIRRSWYKMRDPWYFIIDYYSICVQHNVNISYMVDRIIEVFNHYYAARTRHLMKNRQKSKNKMKNKLG